MLRILALSDFSSNAHNAMAVAMRLTQQFNGLVIFAHAMAKSPVPATAPQSLFSELEVADQEMGKQKLWEHVKQLFQALNIRAKEVTYQLAVVPPPLVEATVQLSVQHHINLVIMGGIGASGLKRIFLGSHTLEMIKRSAKPLLVIPPAFNFESFTNITLIIRPQRFKPKVGINILLQLAQGYGATLHFLFVLDDDHEKPELTDFLIKHNLWQAVQGQACRSYSMLNAYKKEALEEHVKQTNTNLLVVFPSSKSLWEEWFSKNITEEIAQQGKTPLMVFPDFESNHLVRHL